jgi:hypothetical protein
MLYHMGSWRMSLKAVLTQWRLVCDVGIYPAPQCSLSPLLSCHPFLAMLL